MNWGRVSKLLVALVAILATTGCATHYTEATVYDPYGFFSGILHGFLFLPVLLGKILAFFLSLVGIHILEGVQFVGRPNTGFLFYYIGYIWGFFLGLAVWGGAGARG